MKLKIKQLILDSKVKFTLLAVFIFLLSLSFIFYYFFGHHFIKSIYNQQSLPLLNKLITSYSQNSIEHYLEKADNIFYFSLKIFIFILLLIIFVPKKVFKESLILMIATIGSLYLKITPVFELSAYGKLYQNIAGNLIIDKLVSLRWIIPAIVRYIGFRSSFDWLLFCLICFLIGTLFLYYGAYKATNNKLFSFFLALIPTASTLGWFNVYFPGFLDWFTYMAVIIAMFSKNKIVYYIFIILAVFAHERALFVLAFLPIFKAGLENKFEKKSLLIDSISNIIVILIVYFARNLMVVGGFQLTLNYYFKEINNANEVNVFPLTLIHALKGIWEALKIYIVLFLVSFIGLFNFWKLKLKKQKIERAIILLCIFLSCISISFQIIIAIDTVRLMDLFLIPMIFTLILFFREYDDVYFRKYFIGLMCFCFLVNQVLPVKYWDRNDFYFTPYIPKSIKDGSIWQYFKKIF